MVVRTTTHTKNLLLSAAFHSQLGTPERPRLAGAISDNEKPIHDKLRRLLLFTVGITGGGMEAEEPKKAEENAETCDAWGHVIRKAEPSHVEERPMITCECALWGHPFPHWLWSHEESLATT